MNVYYDIVTIDQASGTSVSVDNIYDVIHRYDNRFTHTAGSTTITVNNIDIVFGNSGSYSLTIDGRTTPITSTTARQYTVTILISETIFYFLFKTNSTNPSPVGAFCWIKDTNVNYIGVSVSGSSNGEIDTMNFTNKDTNNTNFTIKRHAKFSLVEPNIVFITIGFIADNSGNYQILKDLKSCSIVEFGSTVCVENNNYYAIGLNTLIKR